MGETPPQFHGIRREEHMDQDETSVGLFLHRFQTSFHFPFDRSTHWLPSSPYNFAFTVPLILQSHRTGIS